jgi:hypothetical protein
MVFPSRLLRLVAVLPHPAVMVARLLRQEAMALLHHPAVMVQLQLQRPVVMVQLQLQRPVVMVQPLPQYPVVMVLLPHQVATDDKKAVLSEANKTKQRGTI